MPPGWSQTSPNCALCDLSAYLWRNEEGLRPCSMQATAFRSRMPCIPATHSGPIFCHDWRPALPLLPTRIIEQSPPPSNSPGRRRQIVKDDRSSALLGSSKVSERDWAESPWGHLWHKLRGSSATGETTYCTELPFSHKSEQRAGRL